MPKDTRKQLGENLRALIQARGFRTPEVFAHENEIDKGWLSRVLNGKIDPGFSKVVRLAQALDAGLDEVYPMKKKS